ncbi:hypothetical protein D3C76_1172410 [compost metagenome]
MPFAAVPVAPDVAVFELQQQRQTVLETIQFVAKLRGIGGHDYTVAFLVHVEIDQQLRALVGGAVGQFNLPARQGKG